MVEPPPANHGLADGHEGLVDVVALVEAGAQAPELVEQRQGLLDDVAEDAQAAAVPLAARAMAVPMPRPDRAIRCGSES